MAIEKKKVTDTLKEKFPEKVRDISFPHGDESITIDRDALVDICRFLMGEPFALTMLLDLTCVDYIGEEMRFEMVYHLFSITNNNRLRIKVRLSEKDPAIDSLTPLWKNANWLEREVYDMFGIHFTGHPYLKRLFMYDGFEGHPLRKDYPLRKRQPMIPMRRKE
jgi:NADH-quinone oxidoreductase subunit C